MTSSKKKLRNSTVLNITNTKRSNLLLFVVIGNPSKTRKSIMISMSARLPFCQSDWGGGMGRTVYKLSDLCGCGSPGDDPNLIERQNPTRRGTVLDPAQSAYTFPSKSLFWLLWSHCFSEIHPRCCTQAVWKQVTHATNLHTKSKCHNLQ